MSCHTTIKMLKKIVNVIVKILDAEIKTPQQINPEEVQQYDVIGFGSGFYSSQTLILKIIALVKKTILLSLSKSVCFVFTIFFCHFRFLPYIIHPQK